MYSVRKEVTALVESQTYTMFHCFYNIQEYVALSRGFGVGMFM